MQAIAKIGLLLSCVPACASAAAETVDLKNSAGLVWQMPKTAAGWSLGTIVLNGKMVEQPARSGLLFLRNLKSGEVRWLAGNEAAQVDARTARSSGQARIDGATFSYAMEVALEEKLPAARLTPSWSVDKDLNGWEVCLAYHDGFSHDWRVQCYPFAGNSEQEKHNQYSVYCYGNRKVQCLDRLFKKTGNPLFEQLKNRVMQLNFFVQVVDGPYRGAITDAIADPWLERGGGYEWRGSNYTSELLSDLMLQLIDMGLVRKP